MLTAPPPPPPPGPWWSCFLGVVVASCFCFPGVAEELAWGVWEGEGGTKAGSPRRRGVEVSIGAGVGGIELKGNRSSAKSLALEVEAEEPEPLRFGWGRLAEQIEMGNPRQIR